MKTSAKESFSPRKLRIDPFEGELTDQQFRSIFAEEILYSVLDENAIIASTDATGSITYANREFARISKFPLKELIGQNHRILNSGYHPPSFFECMFKSITGGKKWRGEIRNRAKDGSFYWVDTTIIPVCSDSSKPVGYVSIRIDITRRKEAEAALKRSEGRFRELIDSASDWYWELDSSFRFCEVSAGVSGTGLNEFFFLGKRPWELSSQSNCAPANQIRSALETCCSFREHVVEIRAVDDSAHWVSLSGKPIFNPGKKFTGFRGIGRWITAQVRAEREVREQANLLRAIKQSFPGGFAVINERLEIVESNTQYRALLNLPDGLNPNVTLKEILHFCAVRGDFGPGDPDELVELNLDRTRGGTRQTYEHKVAGGPVLEIRSARLKEGGWVRTYVDVTERRRAEAEIKLLADHDALTALPNRRALRGRLEEALVRASRKDHTFALLLLDLDRFKNINDTAGHPAGDALLLQVTERLRQCARTGDTVARVGGDEFALILDGVRCTRAGTQIAERIIRAVSNPYLIGHREFRVGVSIGAVIAPHDGKSADQLFKKADIALYEAKDRGRGGCQFFDHKLQTRLANRVRLEVDLRAALEIQQFELFYQPQVALWSGAVIGLEALIRWHHPTRGIVAPHMFIPAAEEGGLISAIGEWVLCSACKSGASWPAHIRVAVNVSPAQLRDVSFLKHVDKALDESGLPACRLELEITESAILQLDKSTVAVLQALRNRGITLAMDDFGAGYSSLNSLLGFSFDRIKIDRSFVSRLPNCSRSLALLRAIVSLGKGLGIPTLAEGIESRLQLDLVREEGCTEGQGYFLGPPIPVSRFELWPKFQTSTGNGGAR